MLQSSPFANAKLQGFLFYEAVFDPLKTRSEFFLHWISDHFMSTFLSKSTYNISLIINLYIAHLFLEWVQYLTYEWSTQSYT